MYDCKRVDLSFFESAPSSFSAVVEIAATPDRVFDAFEDAHAWTVWAPPIRGVEWTSPQPFGVGTTRTVTMAGNMVGEEEFIAWERGKRMAFYFTRCSTNTIRAFAEDYVVTDLGNGRTRVRWTMAMEPAGISRLTMPAFAPLMRLGLAWMLRRCGRYVERAG
jgi:uncharacterized protein YndB with AHSA1/START domain